MNKPSKQSHSDGFPLSLAIIGGGSACKSLLVHLQRNAVPLLNITVIGVCDIDPQAEGLLLAQKMGVYTTNDFKQLLNNRDVNCVLELTKREDVLFDIIHNKPDHVSVIDHKTLELFLSFSKMNQKQFQSAEQEIVLEKMVSDSLMKLTNEPILILNTDFTISEANEAFLKSTGKNRAAVLGSHCYQTIYGYHVHCSSACPEYECPVLETMRTGESAHVIHEWPAADERTSYCNVVSYPVKNSDGEIVKVIEIWQDITNEFQSRWDKRARQLKDDLNKLVHEDRLVALGKLAASCVHEINNPIQGLITFSRLMETTLDNTVLSEANIADMKTYSSLMSGELERCGQIVTGLLSFARETTQAYTDIVLQEVLASVLALTEHKMSLQGIHLRTDIAPRALLIRGDKNQLQQCLLNLIFNAMEAMPTGGELTIILQTDKTGHYAIIKVEDAGSGIQTEHLGSIFDPFFTTKETGQGTGLGLSIVYGVAKSHGGSISVQSDCGSGTTFRLEIPLQAPYTESAEGRNES